MLSVQQLTFFFYWLTVYLKVLMLKCLHFSHTTGSLYYDGCLILQLGAVKMFLLLSVWSCANTYSVMSYGQPFFALMHCVIVPTIWTTYLE